MKSITKAMVIAVVMILAVSLVVAPAAARGNSIQAIESGDTIFVYEKNLDLATNFTGITSLRKYSDDDPTKAVIYTIPVGTASSFSPSGALVSGNFGTYFAYPLQATAGSTATAQTSKNVTIADPTVTLGVYIAGSPADSVDGSSITKATNLGFKIRSAYVAAYYKYQGVYPAQVKVELTTPGGGKITEFGTQILRNINISTAEIQTDVAPGPCVLTNVAAGTYSAVVKWTFPSGFSDYAASSNAVSFTVESQLIKIESNKETVIRGNSFVTTISGESNTDYYVYVKDASLTSQPNYPLIIDGQPGVNNTAAAVTNMTTLPIPGALILPTDLSTGNFIRTMAIVTTKADGTRPIQFNTTLRTDDRSFSIKVLDPTDAAKYDTVKVKVEKGAVTVTASGDQTYFLGEEVTLSGTNTDSTSIYLFITGPNLNTNGERIDQIGVPSVSDAAAGFKQVNVETDDTWEYKWDTANLGLDAGTYTIYAVSAMKNKADVGTVKYETVSVVVKKPFVSATTSASTVAKGDKLFITGTAEGNPTNGIQVWTLGKNYYLRATETVEDDGTFEHEYGRSTTSGMASGQYFVVVQHPMYNGNFDILPQAVGTVTWVRNAITNGGQNVFIIDGTGSLQGSDAAEALVQAINDPNIDDTYTKLTFLVEEPWIQIDPIGDKFVGDTFTISGTSNLAVGDELLVEAVSSSFKPTEKTQSGEFSGVSGTTSIAKGDTYNTWAFDVDAATFKPDEYIVKVESIEAGQTATATFNVLAGAAPTTAPTAGPTAEPTGEPTAEPTAAPTAQPTATPGFGALIALIGLGAVAVLVLRKH